MARRLHDGAALSRTVDGLARRAPTGLECLDRVAAALASALSADRVRVWLVGDHDDAELVGPRLHALVLGEVVSARDVGRDERWQAGARAGAARAALSALVLVFGVPVGTLDVELAGMYDWTVRDLVTAGRHARMIGVALERMLVERAEGASACRSTT